MVRQLMADHQCAMGNLVFEELQFRSGSASVLPRVA